MKTKRQYDKLFEDLMIYTSFSSTNQIKTRDDLRQFFKEVKEDSASKGREFKLSKKLVFTISEAVRRIKGTGGITKRNNRTQTLTSRKTFKTFTQASQSNMTILSDDKKQRIFRSSYKRNNKTINVWRTHNGRFAKKPKEL